MRSLLSNNRKKSIYLLFILLVFNLIFHPMLFNSFNSTFKPNKRADAPTPINSSSSIEDSKITIQYTPSTNFIVNMPSYRPDGDLYIAQIAMDDDTPLTTVPPGWNLIENGYRGSFGEDVRLATYWKIGNSEPSSYTWGVSYGYYEIWIGVIYRINSFDTNNPIHQSALTTGVSSNPTAPSIITTIDDCLVLQMFASDDDWSVSGWPSGTVPLFQNNAGYNTLTSATAAFNKTAAGSTGSGTFTIPSSEKWVGISIAIAPLPDSTPPTYSDLVEIPDYPLELGDTQVIRINTTDPSGINQVLIDFEDLNHSMTYINGDMWEYNSWIPTSVGNKSYTIWMEDNNNNWNSTSGLIIVIDTTAPTYSNIIESADPLPLGQNETISVKVFDSPGSGIDQVLLEYNDPTPKNHTMQNFSGSTWSWSNWKPILEGIYYYKIYMIDYRKNLNVSAIYNFTVISSEAPVIENITESSDPLELGDIITIKADVFDIETYVTNVLIEIESINYTMNVPFGGGNTYNFTWTKNAVGIIIYTIHANDTGNNWNKLTSSFDIIDSTLPNIANLSIGSTLLELGDSFNISVDVWDLSSIKQVRIQFEGNNLPMIWQEGNTYFRDFLKPSKAGILPFTILVQDNNDNWNTSLNNITVEDTISPSYSDLIENPNPVELGTQLSISISVSDIAGIKKVLLEYEALNHSMSYYGENRWSYDTWVPNRIGNYSYTIHMIDNNNNYNSTYGSIVFQDTIAPAYDLEAPDTLELGNTADIKIEIFDFAGINKTLIEFEGSNHSMSIYYGNIWQYNSWKPLSCGNYSYKIYIEDNSGNSNYTERNIDVEDTIAPSAPIITNAPSGDVSGVLIFDWLDGNDPSGISNYILIIDNETDPDITPGCVYNFSISNTGSESSFFELKEHLSQGRYYFFLYQIDGVGHQSEYTMGSFSIVTLADPFFMNLIIIVVVLLSVIGVSLTIIIARRRMKKKILPSREIIPLKLIISHVNKILSSDFDSIKKERPKKKSKKIIEKQNLSIDEEMLKNRIDRIKKFGDELFAEGAYLEAQKQFEFAEKVLLRMGKKDIALEFSNLRISIKHLAEEREKKLELLEIEKLGKDSLAIFELYNDLIELSLRLKDVEIADIYQSELIQLFQADEKNLKNLEYQRFKLYKQANSYMEAKTYEKSAELYEKCEKISEFLVKLGKDKEIKNVEEFRERIKECLKRASQLNNNGS